MEEKRAVSAAWRVGLRRCALVTFYCDVIICCHWKMQTIHSICLYYFNFVVETTVLATWKISLEELSSFQVWNEEMCGGQKLWVLHKTSYTFVQILDFCGITMRSGMPPALKMLICKFQHVALPDLCPKWLVVTAPSGSYLPGCTKTERKPVYPFHVSYTDSCG